jgi:hypoxia up-regulated 1
LNNLESISYRIREWLTDTEFTQYAQTKTVKELGDLVQNTISWLNDDKMSSLAPSEVLKAKLKMLTGLTDPIRERRNEATRRDEVTSALKEALKSAKGMIDLVAESIKATDKANKEMAEKAALEAAEKEAAASEAPPSSTDTTSDPLADLEEPDSTTTSSGAAEEATILPVPAVSPYTEEDLQDLLESHGTITEWLEDRLTIQETKKIYEDPAFKVEELETKANELNEAVMNVLTKSMGGGGYGGKGGKGKGKKATKPKKPKPAKTVDLDEEPSFMAFAKGNKHDEL